MTVGLFTGVETFSWPLTNFDNVVKFCKAHGIEQLVLKIYEITQGEWYSGLGGAKAVVDHIESQGIDVLPYGFFYGYDPQTELQAALKYLAMFPNFCMNMEGNFDNNLPLATTFANGLKGHSGQLWISTWANPEAHGWVENINVLDPVTAVFMPEAYDDNLVKDMYAQYPKIRASIQPTFSIANTTPIAAKTPTNFTLWEWGEAIASPATVDAFVKDVQRIMIVKNKYGMVLDIIQSFQLESGESGDLCGMWSVSSLKYSNLPGLGARKKSDGTSFIAEDLDQWADAEADKYGSHITWGGSSIADMQNFYTDSTDPVTGSRNIHYWEINSSIDRIKVAVNAGYPVVFTANEQNIREVRTGTRPPYPWNLDVNHIIPVLGIDANGNFICPDQLNNNYQGYWPVVYDSSVLSPTYAAVIQVVGPDPAKPWLAPIPNGDPLTWPAGFNAQLFTSILVPPTSVNVFVQKQADAVWGANTVGAPSGLGIYKSWLAAYLSLKFNFGSPITKEIYSTDWNGNATVIQFFAGGARAEWSGATGKTRFYDMHNSTIVEI